MAGRTIVLLVFALCAGIVAIASQDKPADEVIKVETRLVSVPVIVSDRSGRYISGLTVAEEGEMLFELT